MRTGRPKSPKYAKNRVVQTILSEKAWYVYKKVSEKRGDPSWFHRYASACVVEDFENNSVAYLIQEKLEIEKAQDDLSKKLQDVVDRLKLHKRKALQKAEVEAAEVIGVRA